MYATIISLLFAFFLTTSGIEFPLSLNFALIVSIILILFSGFILGAMLLPLQRTTQTLTTQAFQLFRTNRKVKALLVALISSPVILTGISLLQFPYKTAALLIGAAIFLDFMRYLYLEVIDHLDHFKVVDLMTKEGIRTIEQDKDTVLNNWIVGLGELAGKAVKNGSSTLVNHSIDALEILAENFLAAAASISHPTQNPELKAQGVKDTLSFMLMQFLQQLEAIATAALEKKLQFVMVHVLTTLTKLAHYAAKVDLTLIHLPFYFIRKISLQAMEGDMRDIGIKTSIGLVELAKSLAQLKGIAYLDLKTPFTTLISMIDELSKETFKKDKRIKIAILVQPFLEIRSLFDQEPLAGHPDKDPIVLQIDRVISEFQTLEAVLTTMPPLPTFGEEGEK